MFYTKVAWFKMPSLNVCVWDRGAIQQGMPASGLAGEAVLCKVQSHCHCLDASGNTTAPCFTAGPSISRPNPCDSPLLHSNIVVFWEEIWNKVTNIISVLKMWKKIRKKV